MSLGRFQEAWQADPAARSKRCKYAGPGTARHFRAPWPSKLGTEGPEISARSTSSDGQWPGAATRAMAPQPALGQRKELLFLPSRWEFCCINQLNEEPNTIKPKQSPKLGGKTSLMVHSLGDAVSVGGDASEAEGEKKKVDGASVSSSFFHRWAGRPTPLSCFAASLAEQRAKSKWQRPGWRGRKLRVPAAGGGGSVSALEAPSGADGHRVRHPSSLLG